jgi:hypothetical protein
MTKTAIATTNTVKATKTRAAAMISTELLPRSGGAIGAVCNATSMLFLEIRAQQQAAAAPLPTCYGQNADNARAQGVRR